LRMLVELVKREGKNNELYITGGNMPGWAGVATFGDHTNKEDGRRQWTFTATLVDGGTLTLEDGRQLYANSEGWVAAAHNNKYDNNDDSRRTWKQGEGGFLTLPDGKQLYINKNNWAAVAFEGAGDTDNNDDVRKVWTSLDGNAGKIFITSIGWKQIGTIPAGHTTTKEITVGVTQMDSKKETDSTTFTNTFEVSASYGFPIGATVEAKAAMSLELSRVAETMSSTTMTYQEKYEETWEASDKDQQVWGLTMQGHRGLTMQGENGFTYVNKKFLRTGDKKPDELNLADIVW